MRRWAWALVAAVTIGVWAPTLTYDWAMNWDDGVLFVGNQHLRAYSWRLLWSPTMTGHFMPLTWLSAMGTYALAGYHPAAWHGVNVALHTISAVLFYGIARRLVGSTWGAVVAALFFSLHPLRMESVAWISERKDVLMGVFFLGATLLWIDGRRRWAFAAFCAACASKSPAVILPVCLFALEWYRARTTGAWLPRLTRRLSPFVLVSAVVVGMAFWGLHAILASLRWTVLPLGPRLLNVAYSEVFYALQTVWPARLSALIEFTWMPSWSRPEYPIAVGVVLLGVLVILLTWRRWPALTAVAAAYTVAVLPQSGIFQNGPQLVANRYSYLACLPLALLVGAGFTASARRWPRPSCAMAVVLLAALVVRTETALPMWQNGDTMWTYAADHEPSCTQCQDLATTAALRRGDLAQAIAYQQQAIRISATTLYPRWERHWNLATLLVIDGQPVEAIRELRVYLAVFPPSHHANPSDHDHYQRAQVALAALEREPI